MPNRFVLIYHNARRREDFDRAWVTGRLAETDHVLFAEVSDEQRRALVEAGYLVTDWGAVTRAADDASPRRGGSLQARTTPPRAGRYVLGLVGPLLAGWSMQLNEIGAVPLFRLSPTELVARLSGKAAARIGELPFVRAVTPYRGDPRDDLEGGFDGGDARRPSVRRGGPGASESAARAVDRRELHLEQVTDQECPDPAAGVGFARWQLPPVRTLPENFFDIQLMPDASPRELHGWLDTRLVDVLYEDDGKMRVVNLEPGIIRELMRHPAVRGVERVIGPRPLNDRTRAMVHSTGALRGGPLGLRGRGQVIGIADTGIDDTHPDFAGRLVAVIAHGRPSDGADYSGHGTHVAGTAAGSGAAAGPGTYAGIAPEAALVIQALEDAPNSLRGLPANLERLFEEAYQHGVRVHNNSWGTSARGGYPIISYEVDAYARQRPEFVIVVAAGNDGTSFGRRHAAVGTVDWLSLNAPGTSKNAIVVGAARSDRRTGGISHLSYAAAFPTLFAPVGVGTECVSGDPERLAAFSSRGPCNDRRIKPDLVAPGTDILSARSALANDDCFWGVGPQQEYAYSGGTSMAAPVVAGCAALVREWIEARGRTPSAALVRAILINGAIPLGGPDATADHPALPNMHQGFGRVDLPRALGLDLSPDALHLLDSWMAPGGWPTTWSARPLGFTMDSLRWEFELPAAGPLRCCLAYADLPGRSLQNDVNVILTHLPLGAVGTRWVGNADRRDALSELDSDNNVEVIRRESAPAGRYQLEIVGTNLLAEQHFAVALAGLLSPPGLVPVP